MLLLLLLLACAIAWVQRHTTALCRLRPILLAAAAVSRLLRRRAALRRLQPVLRLPRVALRRRRGRRWPARLLLAAWLLLRRRLLAGRLLLLPWLLVACLPAGRLRGRLLGGPRRDAGLCLVLRGVRSPGQTGTLCGSGRRICRRGCRGRRRRLLQTGWPLLVGLAGRLLRRRQSRWRGRALQQGGITRFSDRQVSDQQRLGQPGLADAMSVSARCNLQYMLRRQAMAATRH